MTFAKVNPHSFLVTFTFYLVFFMVYAAVAFFNSRWAYDYTLLRGGSLDVLCL